eukprot:459066_1
MYNASLHQRRNTSLWDNCIYFSTGCGEYWWVCNKRQRKKYYQNTTTGKVTIYSKQKSNKKVKKQRNGSKRAKMRSITNKITKFDDYDAQNISISRKQIKSKNTLNNMITYYKGCTGTTSIICNKCVNNDNIKTSIHTAIFNKIRFSKGNNKQFLWLVIGKKKVSNYYYDSKKHNLSDIPKLINSNIILKSPQNTSHDIYKTQILNANSNSNNVKNITHREIREFSNYMYTHRKYIVPVIFCKNVKFEINIPEILKYFEKNKSLILFTDCGYNNVWDNYDEIKYWINDQINPTPQRKELLDSFKNLIIFTTDFFIDANHLANWQEEHDMHEIYSLYINGKMIQTQ